MDHDPLIDIKPHRRGWQLTAELRLPLSPDTLFPFFADAGNLQKLTPKYLRFKILSPLPIRMQKGAQIEYRLRLHGLPIHWKTEITEWDPPYRFVDTQLKGPYRFWQHEHQFLIDEQGGTRAIDTVQYRITCGKLVHPLFVRRDLLNIFAHRSQVILDRFGDPGQAPPAEC